MPQLRRVLALPLLVLCSPPAAAQEAPPDATSAAHLIATAQVSGRFGLAVCDGERTVVPHGDASFTGPLVDARARTGALVVDTGGLLAPHGVTRFANRDQPGDVVELVGALGYRALAFGENDLGASRPRTLQIAAALREARIPYVLSNLRCEAPRGSLCESLVDASDPPLVLDEGPLRVAYLALLDPSALHRVAPDRSAGLSLSPIVEALPSAVRAARAAGAELVVVALDTPSDATFELARQLPTDGRPDLVLLAHEGDDLIFARPATVVPAIVSPRRGHGVEVSIQRSDDPERGFEMRAAALGEGEPAEAVSTFARAVGRAYCEAWGQPLAGGRLARDMNARGMAELGAQIIREFADADVALFNVEAVEDVFAAASGARLTASDLYLGLEFDEPLVVADVPASWLFAVQERLAEHGLIAPGLGTTADEGDAPEEAEMRIRGRAAVPRASYRVVTLRFLAEGGDDALPDLPEGVRWTTLTHVVEGEVRYHSLREVVLAALERPDERDPRDARPSPDDPPEWILRGQIDADFSGSAIENDAGYEAALLDVESAISMGIEVDLHADATAPLFTFENQLLGRYRAQVVPSSVPGEGSQVVEAADQLLLRSLGSYRGLRESSGQFYIPDLYGEIFLESEITRPDSRSYHWLLLRPTLGLRFPLSSELEVKLSGGLITQLLDPAAEAEAGAGASILLRPWTVIEGGGRSLTAEGLLDFFAYDLGDENRWQLRGSLDAGLDLAGPLAITFGATLYVQREGEQSPSVAFTATVGLRLAAVTRAIGP